LEIIFCPPVERNSDRREAPFESIRIKGLGRTIHIKKEAMSGYQLTWVTDHLAVGCAPLSYEDIACMVEQGIEAIVNLCGEFCDLHEIQQQSGFKVYHLPIPDECAPEMEEMEKTLDWLDDTIAQGKKVLVHCRFGIGRTGTFVTAYLLKHGMNLKAASKILKNTRANPTNHSQWQLLRKYGKKIKMLNLSALGGKTCDLK